MEVFTMVQSATRVLSTYELLKGKKTEFWVSISGDAENRVSPHGANSLGLAEDTIKGKKISEIEAMVKGEWRMCRVGLVKIWFEKI
jgi:hypothetical protein